jgi:glyceraldehyde-3-phosphate dehydrogenase (NAD(P))
VSRLRVAVIGCDTTGRRVADAVGLQPDMELAGVGIRTVHPAALAARQAGARLFCTEPDRRGDVEEAGLLLHGDLRDLLNASEVVVDCTPSRQGAGRLALYRESGRPAVFCGGERHGDIGLAFSSLANYEAAIGRSPVRVASCNTTALARTLASLHGGFGVTGGHAALICCAADPDRAGKGVVNDLTVSPGCSHHADDLERMLPGVRIVTQAISAPANQDHVALLHVRLGRPATAAEALERLARTPRIITDPQPMSTAELRRRFSALGRPRGDWPELVVWPGSVVAADGGVTLAMAIHMEAAVIPETIDCLRAVSGREPNRGRCLRLTDEALGIVRPGTDYDDPLQPALVSVGEGGERGEARDGTGPG